MPDLPIPLHILDLPFNQFLGVVESEQDPHALVLPEAEKFTNHVGTVHAAAMYALSEACCGHRLLLAIDGRTDRFVPLLRRASVKYSKPARGSLTGHPSAEDGAFDKLRSDLEESGRALITIEASIRNQDGDEVMSASCDWFVQAVRE